MTSVRGLILSAAVALCVMCLAVLTRLPEPKTVETAQNAVELDQLKASWGPDRLAQVAFALGFDYLFMAAYVTAFGLGCVTISHGASGFFRQLGLLLGYAQIASGLIDATENATLIWLLFHGFDERLMRIARLATACKFALPAAAFVYIVIGWPLTRWWRR